MPSTSHPSFEGNLLLDALDAGDRALLAPHLVPVECTRGSVLFEADDDVSQVTFPLRRTVATLIVPLRGGRTVETATVGHEGAIGGVVSQGYLPAFTRCVVQIEGSVLRMDADRLREAKRASPALDDLFVRYADCLLAQILQSVACNAAHPIEQRVIRWLLSLQDRLGTDALPVTQNVLATMLGVGRSYITGVLGTLQDQGLVVVGRGRIHILDRDRAETACCECHARVRRHFATVLGGARTPEGAFATFAATEPDTEPKASHGTIPNDMREATR
ncbi:MULTISPECIES: Crp/Fnr family transcriptional regulator [unclassified Methylobacterium]|jgi:Crp-like helix-turn-helix domain|uniref:Crp/Fnr family transcriptional regulator n=1 Tax=unclassified Methylobacterium TaxID=2615210 RepID=UPI0013522F03|nr:Crp/Fnr family transcriptional regulator [Methylobacterium sp. 2A]MWV22197.1 Crp/Fnr family transcriptional regulator [Methylobacterium sp. 2A]